MSGKDQEKVYGNYGAFTIDKILTFLKRLPSVTLQDFHHIQAQSDQLYSELTSFKKKFQILKNEVESVGFKKQQERFKKGCKDLNSDNPVYDLKFIQNCLKRIEMLESLNVDLNKKLKNQISETVKVRHEKKARKHLEYLKTQREIDTLNMKNERLEIELGLKKEEVRQVKRAKAHGSYTTPKKRYGNLNIDKNQITSKNSEKKNSRIFTEKKQKKINAETNISRRLFEVDELKIEISHLSKHFPEFQEDQCDKEMKGNLVESLKNRGQCLEILQNNLHKFMRVINHIHAISTLPNNSQRNQAKDEFRFPTFELLPKEINEKMRAIPKAFYKLEKKYQKSKEIIKSYEDAFENRMKILDKKVKRSREMMLDGYDLQEIKEMIQENQQKNSKKNNFEKTLQKVYNHPNNLQKGKEDSFLQFGVNDESQKLSETINADASDILNKSISDYKEDRAKIQEKKQLFNSQVCFLAIQASSMEKLMLQKGIVNVVKKQEKQKNPENTNLEKFETFRQNTSESKKSYVEDVQRDESSLNNQSSMDDNDNGIEETEEIFLSSPKNKKIEKNNLDIISSIYLSIINNTPEKLLEPFTLTPPKDTKDTKNINKINFEESNDFEESPKPKDPCPNPDANIFLS